jgi:parallel beta-helix repeat protein
MLYIYKIHILAGQERMKHSLFKKGLVVIIIILFAGVSIIPSIRGNILKLNSLDDGKREWNVDYINSYDKTGDANDLHITEDCVYVISDKFDLYDYTYLNDGSNYDQSDNHQFLKFRRIERLYRAITTEKLDNDFGLKNKVISGESNPATFDRAVLKPYIINSGNTFYVGGSGPNNYTSIQDAIDAASDGDTIFVYDDSSPYYENVVIDKSINIIGEDKDSTVINGSKLDSSLNTVNITANNVYIHGFSINDNSGYYYQAAIMIVGDYTSVSNCKIQNNNWIGISLLGSSYSQISDCELYNNLIAIYLIDSNENEIRDCLCHENSDDIILFQNSHGNQIINCTCIGNENGYEGIGLAYAPNTKMRGNILNNNYENFGIGSSSLSDFYCDIDTSNKINDRPIYYWIDHHDEQIPSDAAFIGLISCSNILVKDLEITNNFQGLVGAGISNCIIENVSFRNNGGHGVFFVSSSNNTIRNCSCRNSFFSGIYLVHLSNSNIISNNTFSNIQVCGMWVEESTSNFITGHVIKNCVKGISLDKSGYSVLRNNDMINCGLSF